ncbi:SPOR domain-containing protein [Ancylobacter sp. FA202]|uniref:SPOR domain-containing protein n=1 Tax=Ancylobacter sp. FA202 TaxID=1111106 RepID=UPI00036DA381|nr:SPOR domain-containing protein [Ancylobacter sp. FA202]
MGNENMRDRPENAAEDPLAELARLMAQEDDFAELLRQAPPAHQPAAPQHPSSRPVAPAPTRPPLTARRPAEEGRPAPGSFAALAAEVYGEGVPRTAPLSRSGAEEAARDAHREPARGERPDPRAAYVPPRPQATDAARRMPASRPEMPPGAAPSAPQRPLPPRAEPLRAEAPRPEAPRADATRTDAPRAPAARAPMTPADMARQEALRQDALRQEAVRLDAARQDFARQDLARQEAARQEAARHEAMRREAQRQETVRQDAARREAAAREAVRGPSAQPASADEASDESRVPAWMTRATAAARAVDVPVAPAQPVAPAAPPPPAARQVSPPAPQPVDLDEDAYDYGRSAGDYPPDAGSYDEYAAEEEAPRGPNRKRLLMIGGAVLVFIGAAALGYVLVSGPSGSGVSGAPPVIRADQGPNKVVPNQPVAEQTADGQKLIYDRVGGGATTGNEQVVSSEEQPVDVSQAAQPQPRVIQTTPSAGGAGSAEPKRVRTLTVRADGTVVEVPAPAAPLPPGASAGPAGNPVALNLGTGGAVPTTPMPLSATPSIVENMPADATPAPAPAPTPAAAPAARVAAAPAASASTAAVPAGAFVVQIAAVRSEAEAQATWRSAQARYSDLLRNQPFSVKRADLGDKGIYYRAQVGNFSSREGAVGLCEALRAQGTTCMVARN